MLRKIRQGAMVLLMFMMAAVSPVFSGGRNDSSSKTQGAGSARDLGGIEIVIGNWWANYDVKTYKATNAEGERTLEWRKKIQKDYNFTIREAIIGGWGQMQELTSTSIMAGDPAASVFVLQPNWVMALYNQGLFYPVTDSASVDFSKTDVVNWNQDVKNAFTFKGKSYGLAVGYGTSSRGHGVFFNKRLFKEAGIDPELPYNLQKSGGWTWDAFIDLCKRLTRDVNNDGIIDTYALATFSKDILDAIVASNGARYVDKDRTGSFVNATNRPEFVQALQFGVRLANEGVLMPQPAGAQWNWFVSAFHDGKAAMRVAGQYVNGDLQDMADDWGFVLFPKGPRVSDYKYSADENIYVVPSTFSPEQVDKILYGLYLWLTPAPGNDDPDAWKAGQYNNYRDARAVDETLAMIRDPKYSLIAYNMLIPGLDTGNLAYNMWNEGVDPAQLIESVSQSWNTTISKANGN